MKRISGDRVMQRLGTALITARRRLKHSQLRWVIPAMAWTFAAAVGGLFVYGCSGSTQSSTCQQMMNQTNDTCLTVSVAVTGLAAGQTIVMDLFSPDFVANSDSSGEDNISISGPATPGPITQAFDFRLDPNSAYTVKVDPHQSGLAEDCLITSNATNPSGGITADTIVNMACGYTVSIATDGLTASGLVLEDNGGDDLTVAPVASGATTATFATPVGPGNPYLVTVKTQPAGLTCTIGFGTATGSGTVGTANITNVPVICETNAVAKFTVGGAISGLTASGLVLQDNGGDNDTVAANATGFTFATAVAMGSPYNVTVLTQPTGLTCTVGSTSIPASGTVGSANINNIPIACTATAVAHYTIGGTISGLTASGLVLQNNGGDSDTVAANATSFTFATALVAGAHYNVTVFTQPTGLTCTVGSTSNSASGMVGAANISNIPVACTANAVAHYTIGGTISGLTASGLVLQDNGGDNDTVAANATSFTFATALVSGAHYNVVVLTQPTGLACTAGTTSNPASGTVGTANITNIPISCVSTGGSGSGPLLGILTNTPQSLIYTYTLSLFDVGTGFVLTAQTPFSGPGSANVAYGLTIDHSNNVYYFTGSGGGTASATLNSCPAPASGQAYACSPTSVSVPGGQWLAIDHAGNIYATEITATAGHVVKFTLGNPTLATVYTSSIAPTSFAGLAVTPDGTQLYVSESNNSGIGFGTGVTVHMCTPLPCATAGGTDLTQKLEQAAGTQQANVSGALAIGGPSGQYVFAAMANPYGSTLTQAFPLAIVVACPIDTTPDPSICFPATYNYPLLGAYNSPYVQTVAIAVDAAGDAYNAVVLTNRDVQNGTTVSLGSDPLFFGTNPPPGGGSVLLTYCTPGCNLSGLPVPALYNSSPGLLENPPYSMAITVP